MMTWQPSGQEKVSSFHRHPASHRAAYPESDFSRMSVKCCGVPWALAREAGVAVAKVKTAITRTTRMVTSLTWGTTEMLEMTPNEWRISCEGARGSRRATSQQYQARRLPQIARALDSCMRWLGSGATGAIKLQ